MRRTERFVQSLIMRLIFAIFTFIYLIQTVASFLIQKWTSTPFTTTLFDHDVQDHDDYRNLIQQNLPPTQGFDDNDDDKKLAWARHTIMSIAANVMGIPSDVFTTPPMIDPRPPKTLVEKSVRQKINTLLNEGYPDPLTGFEIPNDEVNLINKINHADQSGHNPSTYGEITFLGSRQLFHYMHIYENQNKPISFIDLGSGNGKLVVQAYLEVPKLRSVRGVELSPSRHQTALSSWTNIREEAKCIRNDTLSCFDEKTSTEKKDSDVEVTLMQGDLFETDISEATHIYVASLCFSEEMMNDLGMKIKNEGQNLVYVATLKPFPSSFEEAGFVREARYVEMSWTKPRGIGGIVYFYSRNT